MPTDPVITKNADASQPRLEAPLPHEVLGHLYATMLRARLLAQRLRKAPRTSEAILAGTLQNTAENDAIVTTSPHPVLEVLRGGDVSRFLHPRKDVGNEDGKIVVSSPATFAAIASGMAFAGARASSNAVVIAIAPGKLTRGATFSEAGEFAAVNHLPLVVIADWTESRRSSRDHNGRALSHWPFPTIAVDGNDTIAVFRVTKEAISAARRGHGPTLIDCVGFVPGGARGRHASDPLVSYRRYLERHNAWNELRYSDLLARYKREIAAAGSTTKV